MCLFDFKYSSFMTVGIELELLIVEKETLLPKTNTKDFFSSIDGDYRPYLQKEYYSQMLEIVSPVFNHIDEIEIFYNDIFKYLKTLMKTQNLNLYACGTHPLMNLQNISVSVNDRYYKLKNELQHLLKRYMIMGLHVHVGMKSEKHLINSFNNTNYLLPLFLPLAASSSFFKGKNTGIFSYRNIILDSLPRSGIAEYFHNYEHFVNLFKILMNNNAVHGYNDIWWDVRPRPDLGTLELRICDSINDVNRIKAVAALFQALCLNAVEEKQPYFYHQVAQQNKWSSIRYGNNGKFINIDNYLTIKDKFFEVIESLKSKGIFSELKTEKYEDFLKKYISEISVAEKMINIYKETDDLKKVISQGVLFQ